MKRILLVSLAIVILLIASGCAQKRVVMKDTYPKMYQNPPISILILPPLNKSTAADAKEYFACSLSEAIGMKGYYPLPVESVFGVLRDEGLYDTENMDAAVLANLKRFFGADAVLQTSIEEWEKTYGMLTITASFVLLNTANADTLWDFTCRTRVDLKSDSDSPLINVLDTAISTVLEDYFPNCLEANLITMDTTLPYGKYHPEFGKDGEKSYGRNLYPPGSGYLDTSALGHGGSFMSLISGSGTNSKVYRPIGKYGEIRFKK